MPGHARRRYSFAALTLLSALLGLAFFAHAAMAQEKKALSNDDIIKMVKGGFDEDVIVSAIESNDTQFDVSLNGLTALKDAGVSNTVMQAMLKAESQRRQAARSASAQVAANQQTAPAAAPAPMPVAPPVSMPMGGSGNMMAMVQQMMSGAMGGPLTVDPNQLPRVLLVVDARQQAMRPSLSQIAHTAAKGGDLPGPGSQAMSSLLSLGTQALSFSALAGAGMFAGPAAGLAMGMMGGMMPGRHPGRQKITHVWALPGYSSAIPMATTSPKFEVKYADLLGIDPDSYEPFLIKLVQTKDNWRLVGATKTEMGREDQEALTKVTEVRIPGKNTRIARGDVVVEAAAPLVPGEYGIVVRPLHPGKRSAGSLGGPAESGAFFSVWDFSVAEPDGSPAPAPTSKKKK